MPTALATLFSLLFIAPLFADDSAKEEKPLRKTPDAKTGELPLEAVRAFPNLRFDRPIFLTHAGDGSNRVFVGEQKGRILVFPNDPEVTETEVFLDIRDRVIYKDKENEEGLLGMAFHPKYGENGQFFLYYTTASAPHTSVVTRFEVSDDDRNAADPKSETELLRVPQPFWNHNGGTIVFGPDGYLYIALGDGGSRNDPEGNAQNTQTLLGSILRIDVDSQADGKSYGIPQDNPFAGKPKIGLPEIFAYGLRNVWRMEFDPETGKLWAADVGQNLWEEINIIEKGGNYGWDVREGLHPFEEPKPAPSTSYIDPVWEYHHDIGKSITGGFVYRGEKLPELAGKYLYADYVTGKLYALDYDAKAGKAVGNYDIAGPNLPVMSFGFDQQGEPYYTTTFGLLYTIAPKK